jgi:ABC-type dipeptide/oligopeptide/nickel transport system ATPase subunit
MSILSIGRLSEQEKELEILVLRHQLAILQRKCDKPIIPNRIEKMTLAVLTSRLKQITHKTTSQLSDILRIFQPETVMGWHRELVRRKWTYLHHSHGGRPK